MPDSNAARGEADELRLRAEAIWSQRPTEHSDELPAETLRVLHELEVHQIELEMQNAELRRAQEELAASHARYFDLFDLAPVGYLTLDAEERIVEANLAAAALLGLERSKLAGQPATRFVYRDDQDAFYLHRKQLTRAGELATCELRLRRPDGVTRWVSMQSVPIEGDEGAQASRVTLTDITERKQADEQMRFQASLLQAMDQAVIVSDLDWTVIYWNRYAEVLYGWPAKEALGRGLRELLLQGLPADQTQALMATLRGGQAWSGEIVVTRKDGDTVLAFFDFSPVQDPQGKLAGAISASRDNAQRQRVEDDLILSREQLRNLSRRLVAAQESERAHVAGQLVDNESQQLAGVLLTLRAMESDATHCPAVLVKIDEAKHMVADLMRDLHGLAVNLRPAALDQVGLMSALRQYAEEVADQYPIDIQFHMNGTNNLQLAANAETGIYRIVQEALSNAVRHSHAREIGVVATEHDDRLVVVIEDDGESFDVDEALRSGRLGLLDMQERAQMLGGTLTIESAPGKGTSVFIVVPLNTASVP